MRSRSPLRWIGVALIAATQLIGCLVEIEDRSDCDAALKVICGCDSHPCDADEPPPIVKAMRRCHESDVRPDDQEGNVHLCVTKAKEKFCRVLDGLALEDGSLCSASCDLYEASCTTSLEAQCHDYQSRSCDSPG